MDFVNTHPDALDDGELVEEAKAYAVWGLDEQRTCLVYATNSNDARYCAHLPFASYIERQARRKPELDDYHPEEITRKILMEKLGWYFSCGECHKFVYADPETMFGAEGRERKRLSPVYKEEGVYHKGCIAEELGKPETPLKSF